MYRYLRILILTMGFTTLSLCRLIAQEDSGWRISPEMINLQVGDDRRLQLLDEVAQELHGAVWSVDDPDLAEIREADGRAVVHAKAVGMVRVSAVLGPEERSRNIQIWPESKPLPGGTTNWGVHAIGREIGDLPAVPTGDGPHHFALEQTADGRTYLRANADDGIQVWTWLMPEATPDVEFVCGDWLGGAVISANQGGSFTLYAVAKNGKLRWQHTSLGLRKGLAISLQHSVYLLSQFLDGTGANFKSLDERTGEEKFDLPLPPSSETWVGIRAEGPNFVCTGRAVTHLFPIYTTRVHVNMDGYPYLAFTQSDRTMGISTCTPGSTVNPSQISSSRNDALVLWQIHPDGTYRSTIVEATKSEQQGTPLLPGVSPTGAIMTDNMNGLLLPVRLSHGLGVNGPAEVVAEFFYRIDPDGKVVYKFPLPKYSGPLHDEMVIASNDLGFATRGGALIAFNVRTGKDLWHWESNAPEISVFAALANGGCLVQTPTALVEVDSSTSAKEVAKGRFMLDWQGRLLRKHN
jgi:outer membrane protein assembly factor BamB